MLKVFSYGGGVQSTAALVLAAQDKIDYQTFLFCNVGADSENPETLVYMHEVALPFAKEHGLELIELQRTWRRGERTGQAVTLYSMLTNPQSQTMGIPVRLGSGAPGNRSCTVDFKIEVVDRWLRERGAKEQGAMVGLGISLDEWQRMRNDSGKTWKRLDYPLIDLRLDRAACLACIRHAGLPVPPKSSCWFCPFHTIKVWQEMRSQRPDLFQKACDLEELMRTRSHTLGKGDVWFTSKGKPLAQVTTDHIQGRLFNDDPPCESGYCFV